MVILPVRNKIESPIDIVGDVYETIFDIGRWDDVFSNVGKITNSFSFLFGIVNFDGKVQDLNTREFDENYLRILKENYTRLNENPIMPLFSSQNVGEFFQISEYFNQKEWSQLGVGSDVFIPQDIHFSLCATIAKGSNFYAPLSIMKSKRQGDFTNQDLLSISYLIPHMVRALKSYLKIADIKRYCDTLEESFDNLSYGVVLLDSEAKVTFLNTAARSMIQKKDGLGYKDGRLVVHDRNSGSSFEAMIGQAIANDSLAAKSGTMLISRRMGQDPIPCVAIPVGKMASVVQFQSAPAVLVIFGKSDSGIFDSGPLGHLYGLSPRQVQLVSLILQGQSLPQAANELGLKLNTAKTHLNRLLLKVGADSLSDLDRTILGGPLGFLRAGLPTTKDVSTG